MLSNFLLLFISTSASYLLPKPPGKYNVTLTTGPLIDYTRDDPNAPTPTPRALMLSIFQPTKCAPIVPVPAMPDNVAEYQSQFLQQTFNISADFTFLFLDARLPVCSDHTNRCLFQHDDFPILLFSTAFSIPRFYYNVLASAIASQGFTVITIDHPYDANILLYPDGHAVFTNYSIMNNASWNYYPRAADASFVIDQLSNATAMAELIPGRGPKPFLTDRVAMLGHSAGGASAILAASLDSRIRAAINWDGTIFGSPPLDMSQPVLFMDHDNQPMAPDWLEAWPQLKGPKMWVRVTNTTHQTFSDMPVLLQAAGVSAAPFAGVLGTIEAEEMMKILVAYTTTWMNAALTGKRQEPGNFLEVSALMKENF
ncbi:PAF acetylhydrolase [Podospora didyma]|uniref:1-alkyl-2-acetylglycerophosphocholine esterase n=1 Tax=Podospora didyma TaxID=330526 RepID=A0AAE0U4X5_9PEZI|nr:PAF acetylhydrolase [Podospora didyma]